MSAVLCWLLLLAFFGALAWTLISMVQSVTGCILLGAIIIGYAIEESNKRGRA